MRTIVRLLLRKRLKRRGKKGMTLMEIMVVIAIIGTIMTVVAVNVLGIFSESNVENTKIQMSSVDNILVMHRTLRKAYPASLEDVSSKFKGGEVPTDAWGNPFAYSCTDDCRGYVLTSLGEDGKSGGAETSADIVSNSGVIQ